MRADMRNSGAGDLFNMYNQRPPPRVCAEYRTHPVVLALTWGALRGIAFGIGVVHMDDQLRRQMLEDNVVAVPHGLDNPILDQRRRQRVVLPLKAGDGS
eukprot:3900980-Alexandrium_andersonii.AAC.1